MRRYVSIIGMAFLISTIFITSISAQDKEECLKLFQQTASSLQAEVRYNYQEWYVEPSIWNGFTYGQKETIMGGMSKCRKILTDYGLIIIKDKYSGKKLAETSVWGGIKVHSK